MINIQYGGGQLLLFPTALLHKYASYIYYYCYVAGPYEGLKVRRRPSSNIEVGFNVFPKS